MQKGCPAQLHWPRVAGDEIKLQHSMDLMKMGYADIQKNENGYLDNIDDWSEDIAVEIASADGIAELSERHWDLIKYLRSEFTDNHGSQPNERNMVKAMSAAWMKKYPLKIFMSYSPSSRQNKLQK
jgi:tRNA 2-thiouridine synthesizing protein E